MVEQCLHVIFPFQDADLDSLFALEDLLIAALEYTHVGEYDGNEVGMDEATFFLYGPDADTLFTTILPILGTSSLTKAGRVVKRYGPPADSAREDIILLSAF